jgi:predicted Zn-dependent protease with MMP-like domain
MTAELPPGAGPGTDDPAVTEQLEPMWDALDEGDFGAALELAEDCVEDHPQSGAAWLGLAAARYETGDAGGTREAAETAGRLGVSEEPMRQWYLAAASHYEWDFASARNRLDELLAREPEFAEAWYLLAQVSEMQGDDVMARRGYARAQDLDPDRFAMPHRIDDEAIHDAVESAREQLPEQFRTVLDELAVTVRPVPDEDLARNEDPDGPPVPPDVLGLFVGGSQLEQSVFDVGAQPGLIFLFQKNLERVCPDEAVLVEEVRITLWHELAHYLGFDEEDMPELGLE